MEGVTESNAVAGTDKDAECVDQGQETIIPSSYPPLPEEPKGDKNLLCRVGVRLPDGRRVQRNFLRADSIQVNVCFCFGSWHA